MEFLILGYDGNDDEALERRMAAREKHLSLCNEGIQRGENIIGAAMLDEKGKMKGSIMIVDLPSREAVDEWLKNEPYMTGDVWKKIEVIPCQIAPSFKHVKIKQT